jgi:hypothetical protein
MDRWSSPSRTAAVPDTPADPERAFAEAERLVREAQTAAEDAVRAAGGELPPSGWAATSGTGTSAGGFPDLSGITALIDAVRGTVPPELGHQLNEALRGLLVALRAVLDFYITRLEPPRPERIDVTDIPID